MSDIYLYVAGSSYVEQKNEQVKGNSSENSTMQPASATEQTKDSLEVQTISLGRGESIQLGEYQLNFSDYNPADKESLPDSTIIAVRANLDFTHRATGVRDTLNPLFAIYKKEGKSWTYAPPVQLSGKNLFVQFTSVDPATGKIELKVHGIEGQPKEEWVLIVAEEKPFVSVVWLGTFVLMFGFSVSIFRHWDRERKKS
jgi:cytochrome c-type biogenesis protein CcmF